MKYRFFNIPTMIPDDAQEAVNRFCVAHRVVSVEKQFVQDAERSYWALCVCYLEPESGPVSPRKGKIDYREVFNEPDFALFARLRNLRKTLAEQEGVPAYALFTNEQLAAMVHQRVTSKAALAAIDGVGTARIDKYGEAFLALLRQQASANGKDAAQHAAGAAQP
jgi:superfamily II DNA helicase RecQ